MAAPIVYGPTISTYVRTVRLTLEEKPTSYELVDVPMMSGAHREAPHLARCPFARVPTFNDNGFELYETSAITRYINQTMPGQDLQPIDAQPRARMNQMIGIVDSYAYPNMITKIVVQRLVHPMLGAPVDETAIKDGIPTAELCLKEFERLMENGKYLVGDRVTLADLFLAPLMHYLVLTPEGDALMKPRAKLRAWWDLMKARNSMASTEPKFG
ncbi:MAG TPA: glutathione S-transferase family protein [Stellaceae bacterium]|nr:glutathione S-transferase family protein [Stellaceae bacterium]